MLAGTACGNYLGGVLADRGLRPALERFALLMAAFIGFAAGPAFVRSPRARRLPGPGLERPPGSFARIGRDRRQSGSTLLLIRAARPGRTWLPCVAVGADRRLGRRPPGRPFAGDDVREGADDPLARFNDLNGSVGFDVGPLLVHLVGAAVGAGIAFGLGYDPKTRASRSADLGRSPCACWGPPHRLG